MRTMIINELKELGYDAKETVVNKNGVELQAIVVNDGTEIGTVIYDNYRWKDMALDDICDGIVELMKKRPEFGTKELSNEDYILENARIVAQKECSDTVWKQDYLKNIKICIRVFIENGSYLLPKKIYSDEIFQRACENTKENVSVTSLAEIILDLYKSMAIDPEFSDILSMENKMYVVTNERKLYGAGIIFMKEFFRQLCLVNHWDGCYIIPSSIHELILLPDTGDNDISYDAINEMITSVNMTEVSEEEQLGDEALYYNLEGDELC